MDKNTFLRDINYVYTIVGSPYDYYTGMTNDGSQLLLVASFPDMIGIFFDVEGNLVRIDHLPLSDSVKTVAQRYGLHAAFTRQGTADLIGFFNSIGYEEKPINVRRFFLNEHQIGIHDFPSVFVDALRHPFQFSEDEVIVAHKELARWEKQGIFELCLSSETNRWLRKTGIIESS